MTEVKILVVEDEEIVVMDIQKLSKIIDNIIIDKTQDLLYHTRG